MISHLEVVCLALDRRGACALMGFELNEISCDYRFLCPDRYYGRLTHNRQALSRHGNNHAFAAHAHTHSLVNTNSYRKQHVCVIGGGFIGIEMAENLRHLKYDVTMIDVADQIMTPMDRCVCVCVCMCCVFTYMKGEGRGV